MINILIATPPQARAYINFLHSARMQGLPYHSVRPMARQEARHVNPIP